LSGAILYLAIVAIWAVVLVPRWLRPRPAPPQPVPVPVKDADASRPDLADPDQDTAAAWTASAVGPDTESEQTPRDDAGGAPAEAGTSATSRRPEVVKARRRLLATLIALTVIAVALAVTRVDAYWIIIPPAALLSGYLLLLRKFTQIDAERARREARIRHDARVRAAQEPGTSQVPGTGAPDHESAPGAPAAPGSAEIIDISGRIGDQVYDQYADAANRAVGD
jgi:hypothetical protein